MIRILLTWGPFALLFLAALLNVVAALLPDTKHSGLPKWAMAMASYISFTVSLAGFVFLCFSETLTGLIGFLLAGLTLATLSEIAIRMAGVRNRANQAEFLWVLAIAVKAGRPLADEIEAFAKGTWGRRRQRLIELATRFREGATMTEIVVPQGLLPPSAMMQIHAGVTSQSLPDSLEEAATRVTREFVEDQDSRCPGSSLIYPLALIPIACAIVSFIMYYIVPKHKKIFDDFNTELPAITKLLIGIADMFSGYWMILVLPLAYLPIGLFAVITAAEYYGWRTVYQSLLGKWFVRAHTPDILRSLSQGIRHGVPIDQILVPIAKFAGPLKLRERLAMAIDHMHSGELSWRSLERVKILKVPEAIALETAQRTGHLPWALGMIATAIERRWSFRIRVILEFVQPALLFVVGLIVGFIVLAMFMPLIKLLNDLS